MPSMRRFSRGSRLIGTASKRKPSTSAWSSLVTRASTLSPTPIGGSSLPGGFSRARIRMLGRSPSAVSHTAGLPIRSPSSSRPVTSSTATGGTDPGSCISRRLPISVPSPAISASSFFSPILRPALDAERLRDLALAHLLVRRGDELQDRILRRQLARLTVPRFTLPRIPRPRRPLTPSAKTRACSPAARLPRRPLADMFARLSRHVGTVSHAVGSDDDQRL